MTLERTFTLSVIIPVYNDRKSLLQAIEGLQTQTFPTSDFEVVIVDNASTAPVQVHPNWPFKLRIVHCERPGSYAARNVGARVAMGKIFAFLDADCIPDHDWLARGLAALRDGSNEHLVGGDVRLLPPTPRTSVGLYQYIVGFQQRENVSEKRFAATANLFCYADQFSLIGPFNERLLSGGDLEWCWRAKEKGLSIFFSDKALVRTQARTSFQKAARQTRRVVGGRMMLTQEASKTIPDSALKPHRSGWQAIIWISTHPQLNRIERIKVLGVAVALRIVKSFESLRLRCGFSPERR